MKLVLKQPQIVATITFGGKEYTKIVGTIDMTDLSGTWTAPLQLVQ